MARSSNVDSVPILLSPVIVSEKKGEGESFEMIVVPRNVLLMEGDCEENVTIALSLLPFALEEINEEIIVDVGTG